MKKAEKGKGPNTKRNRSKGEAKKEEGVQPHDFRKGPESQYVFLSTVHCTVHYRYGNDDYAKILLGNSMKFSFE
jgi:hypothetical protein